MNLFVSADQIGKPDHGAGSVTWNESEALKTLGPCKVYGRDGMQAIHGIEPWGWDDFAELLPGLLKKQGSPEIKLAHFYAGTFSRTIAELKRRGSKIGYTAAAHSIEASRREHEALGVPYNYTHLTDPALWKRYLQGYKDADVLIVPSTHSRDVMRSFGCENRIEVIPHGVEMPKCKACGGSGDCAKCEGSGIAQVAPLPKTFTVGYLGAIGPDKGLRYLFAAWKKLGYPDAVLKVAGRDSTHPWLMQLWQQYGGGNVQFCGWQEDVSDFYNSLSCYCQSSASEGFGIEVLEAQAHGRPAVCSMGVGAADTVPEHWRAVSGDADDLAARIDYVRLMQKQLDDGHVSIDANWIRANAESYSWDKIRIRYVEVWKELLG